MANANLPIEIAQMIEQLGGRRIFAMAFTSCVYSVASDDDAQCPADRAACLSLEIARPLRKTARGAAKVIVVLEWDDTYTVKLWKAPTAAESQRGEHEGRYLDEQRPVYADQLRDVVERMTGLLLSLGTMRVVAS
jgi:hypothetical protein